MDPTNDGDDVISNEFLLKAVRYCYELTPIVSGGYNAIDFKAFKDTNIVSLKTFITQRESTVLTLSSNSDGIVLASTNFETRGVSDNGLPNGNPPSMVIIIKIKPVMDPESAVESQLLAMRMTQSLEIDALSRIISTGITSVFKFASDSGLLVGATESSINRMRSKIDEFSLAMRNTKSLVSPPNLLAETHPLVQQIRDKGALPGQVHEFLDGAQLNDIELLNSLHGTVNHWVYLVQSLIDNPKRVEDGTALDEITFWQEMEQSLLSVQEQLGSTEAQITIEILTRARRLQTAFSILTESTIPVNVKHVKSYNLFLGDIPAQNLRSVTTIPELLDTVDLLSVAFKKLRTSLYPTERAQALVELLASEFLTKIKTVIPNITTINIDDIEGLIAQLNSALDKWDDFVKDFTLMLREVIRKRSDKYIPIKIVSRTEQLRQRLLVFGKSIDDHTKFSQELAAANLLKYENDLNYAFEPFRTSNCLTCSPSKWQNVLAQYNRRINLLENKLISYLSFKLHGCESTNEMFISLEQFRPMLGRPRLRKGVQEYQAILLEAVSNEFLSLKQRMSQRVFDDQTYILKDIPTTASSAMQMKAIKRRTRLLLSKLTLLVGDDWESTEEGMKIQLACNTMTSELDENILVDSWCTNFEHRKDFLEEPIFKVSKSDNDYIILLNSEPLFKTLFKEVRNLNWMGMRLPHDMTRASRLVRGMYPSVIEMIELLHTFMNIAQQMTDRPLLNTLLQKRLKSTWILFKECLNEKWNALALQSSETANNIELAKVQPLISFKTEVNDIIESYNLLEKLTQSLRFEITSLSSGSVIQQTLDSKISNITSLAQSIRSINRGDLDSFDVILDLSLQNALFLLAESSLNLDYLPKQNHEVVVVDGRIIVSPSLEISKMAFFRHTQSTFDIIRDLGKKTNIESGHQEVCAFNERLQSLISASFEKFYHLLLKASELVDNLKKCETLWTIEDLGNVSQASEDLGYCYQLCCNCLAEKRRIAQLDSQINLSSSLTLNLARFKFLVKDRFDALQNILDQKLMAVYVRESFSFHEHLSRSRERLEAGPPSIENCTLDNLHELIDLIDELSSTWLPNQELLETFKLAHRFLTGTNNAVNMSNVVHFDQLELDVLSLQEIASKRASWVLDRKPIILQKLEKWNGSLAKESKIVESDWEANKPVSPEITPTEALATISRSKLAIDRQRSKIEKANAVAIFLSVPVANSNALLAAKLDIENYESVWNAISHKLESLQQLLDTHWRDLDITDLERCLRILMPEEWTSDCGPAQQTVLKAFACRIRDVLSSLKILTKLKDSCMRSRHWMILFKDLGQNMLEDKTINDSTFTLGQVLSLELVLNEPTISEILQSAKSEETVEASLRTIEKHWEGLKFTHFRHSGGIPIIKEWKHIFSIIAEDLDTLNAMKHSSFHKTFEQQSIGWELKLNEVAKILTDWAEAQRVWLYLHGVLGSKKSSSSFLPSESSRFSSITFELNDLICQILQSEIVLDSLHVVDCSKSLCAVMDSLNKILGALNEYLETQRERFPRLYFLGNEDLLQLIGASQDLSKVSNHIGKLYGGVSNLVFEAMTILGVRSPEGEELLFQEPMQIAEFPKMEDWMAEVESKIKLSIVQSTRRCIDMLEREGGSMFSNMFEQFPFQALLLALQIRWTTMIEKSLSETDFSDIGIELGAILNGLSELLREPLLPMKRRKAESLLTECIHFHSLLRKLNSPETSERQLTWSNTLKYYITNGSSDDPQVITIRVANHNFYHGLEYIGIPERLVHTPLLDNCFVAMAHALSQKMGCAPFGPAGTGKTETVKAFGQNLGRMVLVFNCDESFDFQSIGRLLFGIAQIGAWGCFDEFNRLGESIMSAVSTQIGTIQDALSERSDKLTLLGKTSSLNSSTGVFVTMNHGYKGRRELPDNLRKKFRPFSMKTPDNKLIAEVTLTTLGIEKANVIATKVSNFLSKMELDCSTQKHYDFGLRSMKAILRNCRVLKDELRETNPENILCHSLHQMLGPRLVERDERVLQSVSSEIFPDISFQMADEFFQEKLKSVCSVRKLVHTESFQKKCRQFYHIQKAQQAIILSGQAGTGKSSVWKATIECMKMLDGMENFTYVIDSKVMTKEQLYGNLDPVTFEWTDGLFTSILRQVSQDSIGKFREAHIWIVFDSDLDPDYVETINSVLDDNKVFTLPNGERLSIPSNLKFIFEVEDLAVATPATVSRCAVVILNRPVCNLKDLLSSLLSMKLHDAYLMPRVPQRLLNDLSDCILGMFDNNLNELYDFARKQWKALKMSPGSIIQMFISLMFSQLPLYSNVLESISKVSFCSFAKVNCLINMIWAMASASDEEGRILFENRIKLMFRFEDHSIIEGSSLTDYRAIPDKQELGSLLASVPRVTLEANEVLIPDLMIPTVDTIKHERLIFDLLSAGQTPILCGPPGSGKTMTLYNALKKSKQFDLVGLTFSNETSVTSVLKTLKHHTVTSEKANVTVLKPKSLSKSLVLFCDEINLPQADDYGAQPVILLLRQIIEKKGYWDVNKCKWVSLERIHVVGACNPPDNNARSALTERFTRHTAIISIEYPPKSSLLHIYETLFKAVLSLAPDYRGYHKEFAHASVALYYFCKETFTVQKQLHYVFSPRELTRWVKGIYHILANSSVSNLSELIEYWAYEASRLFSDRLVDKQEKSAFNDMIENILCQYFPNVISGNLEVQNMLLSNWLTLEYKKTSRAALTSFVKERLKTFAEEELEISLIVHDSMIDHMVRIDRAMKQDQGHCILIGPSRCGKRTLTRFVSWMNGMEVVQLSLHRNFHVTDFDRFLRMILTRCTIGSQKITLLIDDSSIMESGFIERMNTLLANSDIPGLFEAEDRTKLIYDLSKKAEHLGLFIDGEDELYCWFTRLISQNLHVVFSINDPNSESATNVINSPALFNRCVLDWFGDWSRETLTQVGSDVVEWIPLSQPDLLEPSPSENIELKNTSSLNKMLVDAAILFFEEDSKSYKNEPATPGRFLDHLMMFRDIYAMKANELEQSQRFITTGLDTLKETVFKVKELNGVLSSKELELTAKEQEARNTLDVMLTTQNEAERRHEATVEIRKILGAQEEDLNTRRSQILSDLALVEPQILEAQRGVNNIKKQHMTEIRSMFNPPNNVKLTLEAVCIILGHSFKDWKDIQQFVRRDEFISSIVNYDTERMMSGPIRERIKEEYLSKPNFHYQTVNHASKACGPLFQWAVAQVEFSRMLTTIVPLKHDISKIEQEMMQTKARLLASEDMISDYKKLAEDSKEKYSAIIRETEAIKSELAVVRQKVSRSRNLLKSLSVENARWSNSTKMFLSLKRNLIGDCFLSSLHATYCGHMSRKVRHELTKRWKGHLRSIGIGFDENYNFADHIVEFQERCRWISLGVPDEDFCIENFYLIQKGLQYPFVIDPESRILTAIQNNFTNTLTMTSFLDSGFLKRLENALRFGGCVLIEDGEFFDPIISKLIAKEFKKMGGRETVQIGENEIDVAPNFSLIIVTKDATCKIPTFLGARMTVVDFSIDKSSVESQALEITLESEKPDIYQQRKNLAMLNGEYKLRLSSLEEQLLNALNSAGLNILDNENLITMLEQLKVQSNEVEVQMEETKGVIEKVDIAVDEYRVLGQHALKIYDLIEMLPSLHWAYQITIKSFFDCYKSIFEENLHDESDRVHALLLTLYRKVFEIFSPNLSDVDKTAFEIMLFMCFFESNELSLKLGLKQIMSFIKDGSERPSKLLEQLPHLELKPAEAVSYMQTLTKEIMEARTYDQLSHALDFLPQTKPFGLYDYVTKWGFVPILLASERGTDGTYRISQLASDMSRKLAIISLGSVESTAMAENSISQLSRAGGWILIQNLQMSADWVKSVLTKRLEALASDVHTSPELRIFMTCELEGRPLPPPLVQTSWKVTHEGEKGLIKTASDIWRTLFHQRVSKCPEKLFCQFLLVWFHALLVESSHLSPLGFTKKYDFNDSDFAAGIAYLDVLFDSLPGSAEKVNSEDIPWNTLQFNVANIIYGGKTDEDKDLERCNILASTLFHAGAFAPDFELAPGISAPRCGNDWANISEWLTQCQAPADWSQWPYFAQNVEDQRQRLQAQRIAESVLVLLEGY